MIPAIALIIAVYGCARLFNDCLKRYPGNLVATVLSWVCSVVAGAVIVFLALAINASGSQTVAPNLYR
jgi:hypothetical protein